jgi:hypothetical protein
LGGECVDGGGQPVQRVGRGGDTGGGLVRTHVRILSRPPVREDQNRNLWTTPWPTLALFYIMAER